MDVAKCITHAGDRPICLLCKCFGDRDVRLLQVGILNYVFNTLASSLPRRETTSDLVHSLATLIDVLTVILLLLRILQFSTVR